MTKRVRAHVKIGDLPAAGCYVEDRAELRVGGQTKVTRDGAWLPMTVKFTGYERFAFVEPTLVWIAELIYDPQVESFEAVKRLEAEAKNKPKGITRREVSIVLQRLVAQVGAENVDEYTKDLLCRVIVGEPFVGE